VVDVDDEAVLDVEVVPPAPPVRPPVLESVNEEDAPPAPPAEVATDVEPPPGPRLAV
jgi:hypothetical protein